jgi:hypothetical protein
MLTHFGVRIPMTGSGVFVDRTGGHAGSNVDTITVLVVLFCMREIFCTGIVLGQRIVDNRNFIQVF